MRNAQLNTTQRAYFDIRLLDAITPALSEAGGQPQISINGSSWSNSGISILTSYSYGHYYADIQAAVFDTIGNVIESRYKSNLTLETTGDSFIVTTLSGSPYDPTLSQLVLDSYVELNEAEMYFANRSKSDVWIDSSNKDKANALRDATKQIDRLSFSGTKLDPSQLLEFPRTSIVKSTSNLNDVFVSIVRTPTTSPTSPLVPNNIKAATCEIAIDLLDGKDVDEEINNLYAEQRSYTGIRTHYDRKIVVEHIRAGIISPKAWIYLKPYLITNRLGLSTVRVS